MPAKICSLLLVLTMLLRPIELQDKQIKRYACDTKERIDEIHNLKYYLKRLIRHDQKIYFVLRTRVIWMEVLLENERIDRDLYDLFDPDGQRDESKPHNALTLFHYLNFDLYEQETEEEVDVPDGVPNRFKVFGHIYNKKLNVTSEFYFVRKADLSLNYTADVVATTPIGRSRTVKNFEIYNSSYLLNFDLAKRPNAVLAERDRPADATHLYLNKPHTENPFLNIVYFNRIYVENSGGQRMDLRIDLFYDQLEYNASYTEGVLVASLIYAFGQEKARNIYRLANKPDYRTFVFYMRDLEFGYQRLYHNQLIYFFGFDESAAIELSVYNFNQNQHELLSSVLFDPEELFDCFTKLTHERQLKGVYFDSDSKLFFVFIKRFYLKIDQVDLVRNEFVLHADWYADKAYRLPIAPFYEKIATEFLGRKWVKALGPNTVYSSNNRHFYRLSVQNKEELSTASTPGSGFRSCYQQTLMVDEQHVFCFRRSEYFFLYTLGNESLSHYWNKNRHPIGELFEETALDWSKQRLVLIFNYKEDRFVMLTQTDLFVFEYKKFTLLPGLTEDEHKIRYLHELDEKQIKRKRNCLLLDCKATDSSLPDDRRITSQSETPINGILALFLGFLVVLVVLLIIVLLTVSFTHMLNRPNLFNRYNKYYNQPKAKDAKRGKGKGRFRFSIKVKR